MTIIDAYKLVESGDAFAVRRKNKPSHVGSNGEGWVDAYYLLNNPGEYNPWNIHKIVYLTPEDIIADDWEVK